MWSKLLFVALLAVVGLVRCKEVGRVDEDNSTPENTTALPDGAESCSCHDIEGYFKEMESRLLGEVTVIKEVILEGKAKRMSKLGKTRRYAAESCNEIAEKIPDSPSGYYWVEVEDEEKEVAKIYCAFDFSPPGFNASRFNSSAPWIRVAYWDTSVDEQCPDVLSEITVPKYLCAKAYGYGCDSITFPIFGVPYQWICGRAVAYQYRTLDAFYRYSCPYPCGIDQPYVDGISITHGYPRNHIWSYAGVWTEDHPVHPPRCPCIEGTTLTTPEFVGNDYYCEMGDSTRDQLWDGENCDAVEAPCCERPEMPWFCKELSGPTVDDIEVRLCADQSTWDENIYVEAVELYIQ